MKVTRLAASESAKKGIFSRSRRLADGSENRLSGQKSSSSKTNGSVTTIGLLIRPSAKKNSAST